MVSLLRNICAGRSETGLVLWNRAVLELIPDESPNLHLKTPKTPLCIHFHLIAVYECGHRRPINHKGSAVKDSYNCRRVTFIFDTHQSCRALPQSFSFSFTFSRLLKPETYPFNATRFKDLGSSDVQDIVPRKFSSDGVIVWAEFHGQFRLFFISNF